MQYRKNKQWKQEYSLPLVSMMGTGSKPFFNPNVDTQNLQVPRFLCKNHMVFSENLPVLLYPLNHLQITCSTEYNMNSMYIIVIYII